MVACFYLRCLYCGSTYGALTYVGVCKKSVAEVLLKQRRGVKSIFSAGRVVKVTDLQKAGYNAQFVYPNIF